MQPPHHRPPAKRRLCPLHRHQEKLLFFTKGQPTKEIWYYEHQYPVGVKSYNKTKPIRIEEFDVEKAWWGIEADGFASRIEGEFAWKVGIDTIKAAGFNLDQKNPHAPG